jgi:Ca2+-binding RTX toxin-like protein
MKNGVFRIMANTINGTDKNDKLAGTNASDDINGLAGADTMTGGIGDDTYHVDNAGDKIVEAKNAGFDTILSTIDYSLLKSAEVENLALFGAAIKATGNALGNIIGGNDQNNIIDGGKGNDLLSGGQGNDTYLIDSQNDGVIEEAGAGRDIVVSTVALTNAFSDVEDYTFKTTHAVDFTGNALDNFIVGGSGNDVIGGGAGLDNIDGGKGADVMFGGTGSDVYHVDNVGDVVAEAFGEGQDSIVSSISLDLLAANVETALLVGNGALHLTGNELDNLLMGNNGANLIDGGKGEDVMLGGRGDDIYVVDNAADFAIESKNAGKDTVKSAIDFTLGDDIETLILTGKDDIDGKGNALDNILIGNDGDNRLDGGAGKDVMEGGKGDDRYLVDDKGDKVIETLSQGDGGGADVVEAGIDYSLAALTNVENLVLAGDALKGTGNAQRNFIFGNANDNVIDGGKGADFMLGGTGDDTYLLDDAGDAAFEDAGEGVHDKVITSVLLTDAFDQIEDYVFNTSKSLDFTANDRSNTIIGGSANDFIDGKAGSDVIDGGKGADQMTGGTEGDLYIVDNLGDTVVENFDEGFDVVRSSVTISALWNNVEQAELTGTANINVTGNALHNTIFGNAGANIIDGGADADEMHGGKGNDIYIVDNAHDLIVEFAGEGIDLIKSSVSYSVSGNVENLTLTGSDDLFASGDKFNNVLTGNDGNNILNGGDGKDTLIGGKGDDTYFINDLEDKIVETLSNAAGGGIDTVKTSVDFSLAGLANVDNITVTTVLDVDLTGNAQHNVLIGGLGHNVLDGGAGADLMQGMEGNDTYRVDNANDQVVENADGGNFDIVLSQVSITQLWDNVEVVLLEGNARLNATGNGADNLVLGNAGSNILDGDAGADLVSGGKGADTLTGGSGTDSFQFVVFKGNNEGHDTITDFLKSEDILDFHELGDLDKDGALGLGDLLAATTKVVDHGLGNAVDVFFANGSEITFSGVGTGQVNSIDDLVANVSQIHVS